MTILDYKERPEGQKDYIEVLILVERDSQKTILIGSQGRAIKELMAEARSSIEEFIGKSTSGTHSSRFLCWHTYLMQEYMQVFTFNAVSK